MLRAVKILALNLQDFLWDYGTDLFHYSPLLLACLVIVLRFMKRTTMVAGTTLALSWEYLYSMGVAQRELADGKKKKVN